MSWEPMWFEAKHMVVRTMSTRSYCAHAQEVCSVQDEYALVYRAGWRDSERWQREQVNDYARKKNNREPFDP